MKTFLSTHPNRIQSMDKKTEFKNLITEAYFLLKKFGFKKRKETFYLLQDDNWGLINFQTSQKSCQSEIIFTLNVGIMSRRLYQFLESKALPDFPPLLDCHLQQRAGILLPERGDKWWLLNANHSTKDCFTQIKTALEKWITPYLQKNMTDSNLIELWEDGTSPGLTEFGRLLNLLILKTLTLTNPDTAPLISQLKKEAKDKPMEDYLDTVLKKLKHFEDSQT